MSHFRRVCRREISGNVQFTLAVEVLRRVVIELVARDNLARDARAGMMVPDHTNFDLARVYCWLNDCFLVMAERFGERSYEFGAIVRLANANA